MKSDKKIWNLKPREAIKAIKSNYPPERYTMLREALDLAMDCLEKKRAMWPKATQNKAAF